MMDALARLDLDDEKCDGEGADAVGAYTQVTLDNLQELLGDAHAEQPLRS